MPRFLAPITVDREFVTENETISGSETILGATSGKDSYWTSVNVSGGLSANIGTFTISVSSPSLSGVFYGDGSKLTGISSTQIDVAHYFLKSRASTNRVGVMNTGVTPNTFTFSTNGALLSSDYNNYLPTIGDVVLFTNQTTQTQNGPWAVTDIGSPSTSAVFTRPSWFSGSVKQGILLSETRGSGQGFIWSLYSTPAQNLNDAVVGQTNLLFVIAVTRASSNATTSSNSYTSTQTLAVGTTATAPLRFQSGALLSAPLSGAIEWDGFSLYTTNSAASRKPLLYSDFSNVTSGPVNLLDGLNAGAATFTISVSSPALSGTHYGDGSKLTGIIASGLDVTKLPLSGGALTGSVTSTSTISSSNTITGNNISTQNQIQYLSSGVLKAYQYYNSSTNSLDTVFV